MKLLKTYFRPIGSSIFKTKTKKTIEISTMFLLNLSYKILPVLKFLMILRWNFNSALFLLSSLQSYLPVHTSSDRDRSNNIPNCFWVFGGFRRSSFRFLSPCWSHPLSPTTIWPTTNTRSQVEPERRIIWNNIDKNYILIWIAFT